VPESAPDGCGSEIKGDVMINPEVKDRNFASVGFYQTADQTLADGQIDVRQQLARIHRDPDGGDAGFPRFTIVSQESNADLRTELMRLRGPVRPKGEPNSVKVQRSVLLQIRVSPYNCELLSTEKRDGDLHRPCLLFKPKDPACPLTGGLYLDQARDVYFRVRGLSCGL
jgi:hypothetical protein